MKILQELCSLPTAPYAEHRIIKYVEQFVWDRPGLKLSRDRFQNLLIERPGKSNGPRLVFVAHMDHPGFVARRMISKTTVEADFYGGVLDQYVQDAKVRFFDHHLEIRGRVISTQTDPESPNYPRSAKIHVRLPVPAGAPGMFDQGIGRFKGTRFLSRVCDDLAGAAATLTMIDQLRTEHPQNTVCVLLTRAEEDAFIGAIASVLEPTLLQKTDRVISIECSAMQKYARQGNGVVLRVGDRTSIFNSAFMYFLHQQAEAMAKKDKKFKYQRALMPGGTCEATVFDLYGYATGALCVPLGNYHNMDRTKKRIGPEYVDTNDWNNMVKLFIQIAKNIGEFDGTLEPLRQKLEKRFARKKKLITE